MLSSALESLNSGTKKEAHTAIWHILIIYQQTEYITCLVLIHKLKYLSGAVLVQSYIQTQMKVAAAYLLAKLGGNDAPTADDISKILGSGTLFPAVVIQ